MSANPPPSVQEVYLTICRLTYDMTQLALAPMPPFAFQDQSFLTGNAQQLAQLATQFRQADATKFVPAPLAAATAAVSQAQKTVTAIVSVAVGTPSRSSAISDMLTAAAAVAAAIPS